MQKKNLAVLLGVILIHVADESLCLLFGLAVLPRSLLPVVIGCATSSVMAAACIETILFPAGSEDRYQLARPYVRSVVLYFPVLLVAISGRVLTRWLVVVSVLAYGALLVRIVMGLLCFGAPSKARDTH